MVPGRSTERSEESLVDNLLRWTVTVLFGVSFAAYGYFLFAQHAGRTNAVNHALHLAMSAAMVLMAWGVGTSPATVAVMIGFLAAGAWFAGVAARTPWAGGERLTNCYYAAMMATMAWMYASTHGHLGGHSGHSTGRATPAVADMQGMPAMAHETSPHPAGPEWVTAVTWIAIAGFAAVAIYWAFRSTTQRRAARIPALPRLASVQSLTQALTAAGTALMLAEML
jgi:Domain of unknown function (DUF5134)